MSTRALPRTHTIVEFLAAAAVATAGCASSVERSTVAELRSVQAKLFDLDDDIDAEKGTAAPAEPAGDGFAGSLGSYLRFAFAHSPELRATFETWQAATYRPAHERRLPEPVVSYSVFLRSVETRVGPQQHRVGATQWFPWPTRLTAGSKAAGLEAQAAQRRFEARALKLSAEVSRAYWAVWRLQRKKEVLHREVQTLEGLSKVARTRRDNGLAQDANFTQIDLALARSRDKHVALHEAQIAAHAELLRVLGISGDVPTPTDPGSPLVAEFAEPLENLVSEANVHPTVQRMAGLSDAQRQRFRKARAQRLPSLGLGATWMITGESPAPTPPPDSGRDAVALNFMVKVPIAIGAYKANESEARARQRAFRAQAIAARNGLASNIRKRAANVREQLRRARLYKTTLVPQADATYRSVLKSYDAGDSTVAELLSSERDLTSLKNDLFAAEAKYASELASLEEVVGRPVRLKQVDEGASPGRADAPRTDEVSAAPPAVQPDQAGRAGQPDPVTSPDPVGQPAPAGSSPPAGSAP